MTIGDAYRALGALADEVGDDIRPLFAIGRAANGLAWDSEQREWLASDMEESISNAGTSERLAATRRECARILREVNS